MKKETKILIFLFIVAFLLRAINIDQKKFGVDEVITFKYSESFKAMDYALKNDYYPPLFYAIIFVLRRFFSVIALRVIFILIALAGIAFFWFALKEFFPKNKELVWISILLIVFNPLHIAYSSHLRHYIILITLFALSAYLIGRLLRLKDIKEKRKILWFLSLTYVMLVYLHYVTALFIIFSELIFLFLFVFKKSFAEVKKYWKIIAVFIILIMPIFIFAPTQIKKFESSHLFGAKTENNLTALFYNIYKLVIGININSFFYLMILPVSAIVIFIFIILFSYGLILTVKSRKREPKFFLITFVLSIILSAFLYIIAPMLGSFRYYTFLIFNSMFFVALSIDSVNNKNLKFFIISLIILIYFVIFLNYSNIILLEDWNKYFGL
ncbi:MAG: hypothetical protein AB1467_05625 [Candidatus Diapherotrites archaeon]